MTSIAQTKSARVEGSGTRLTLKFTGCGWLGSETVMLALVPG